MNKLFVYAAILSCLVGLAETSNATSQACDTYTSGKDCNKNKGTLNGQCQWVRGEAHGPSSYCREEALPTTPPFTPSPFHKINPLREQRNVCTEYNTGHGACIKSKGTYKNNCLWVRSESGRYGECREKAPEDAPFEEKVI